MSKAKRIVVLVFPDGSVAGTYPDLIRKNPSRYRTARKLTSYRIKSGDPDRLFDAVVRWA